MPARASTIRLPLVGEFQVENALVAAGLAIATGGDPDAVFAALAGLKGAKGRLDLRRSNAMARRSSSTMPTSPTRWPRRSTRCGPMRPGNLVVVFGAGGDRDPGKRPHDGRNRCRKGRPRHRHRRQPAQRGPSARSARRSSRLRPARARSATVREAIRAAIAGLERGDVLLIAGKGHESGQIIGNRVLPFSDHEAVAAALKENDRMSDRVLWTVAAMADADAGAQPKVHCRAPCPGLSIDTRTIGPAEAFFAIAGEHRDGHDFVADALQAGAGLAVVSAARRAAMPKDAPLLVVADVLDGLRALARAARERSPAKIVAVTGSVGKTGTKEALRLALGDRPGDPCVGRLLQQPLGRAALARALPGERKLRRVRTGHESCGRDRAAGKARASARGYHHIGRAGASRIFRLASRRLPTPRPRYSAASCPAAPRCSTATIRNIARLRRLALDAGIERIVTFGEHKSADARLVKCALQPGLLDGAGAHPRQRRDLQARRARAPSGAQLARRAGGGCAGRRRSRARRAGARRASAGCGTRRAHHAGISLPAPPC